MRRKRVARASTRRRKASGPARAAKQRGAKKRAVSAKKRTTSAKKRTTPAKRAAAKKKGASAKRKPVAKRVRPRLRVVRTRRARPAPSPPAFQQSEDASSRQLLLFQLVRARAAVLAAIQGLSALAADTPMGEGKWSVRQTVLHLIARDRARLAEIDAARAGTRASWIGNATADWDRLNAEEMAPLAALSWEEALRLLQTTRRKLMEMVEAIPEEPAEVWSAEHPLAEMLAGLPPHDRHHADIVKSWREAAAPSTG